MFSMGHDTNCKQDVVDQNGGISERERDFFFSFVASVVKKKKKKICFYPFSMSQGETTVQQCEHKSWRFHYQNAQHCSTLYFSSAQELFYSAI